MDGLFDLIDEGKEKKRKKDRFVENKVKIDIREKKGKTKAFLNTVDAGCSRELNLCPSDTQYTIKYIFSIQVFSLPD